MINSYKSLCVIVTILLSAFAVFAQGDNYKSDFTVKFPLGSVTAGQTIEISIISRWSLLNSRLSSYPIKWSVTNGEIIEGQGTPTIKVKTDEGSETLTARVEILDIYIEPVIASGTIEFKKKSEVLEAVLYDELRFTSLKDKYVRARFQAFVNELNNKPSARGYIFIQSKNAKSAEKIEEVIGDYGKKIGFDMLRITIRRGMHNNINIVGFYVVPPGAKTPTPASGRVNQRLPELNILSPADRLTLRMFDNRHELFQHGTSLIEM